jgi:hypothetical protein
MSRRVACLAIALAVLPAGARIRTPVAAAAEPAIPAIDVAASLDAYARGAHEAALEPLRRASVDEIRDFGPVLTLAGQQWVDRVPEDRPRRALVAAAFAIESQALRAERGGWVVGGGDPPCHGPCVLEWACALLQSRGEPDEVERTWMLASVALAGGVRDWAFLYGPLAAPGPRTVERGHLVHARARFPNEPRFRLARAVAIASRLATVPEFEAPRAGVRTGPAPSLGTIRIVGLPEGFVIDRRAAQLDYAGRQFQELLDDAAVGAEARVRLAYLDYRAGAYESALSRARESGETAANPDVRYLARFLASQAAQAIGDLDLAESLLASALEARPHSQSAAIALAALQYRRGAAEPAYALVEATFLQHPADDDPWRLFLYGDFPRLPALIAELRRLVGGAPRRPQ